MQRADFTGAIELLEASAAVARSQHALVELGRTLAVLADATCQHGDEVITAQADEERSAVVEQIGPEVRGLPWAQGLARTRRGSRAGERKPESDRLGPLTPREREVALLIAQGLSDRQIADRLIITEGTAGVHVGHILNKLGFHARTEIARWVVQHELGPTPDLPR